MYILALVTDVMCETLPPYVYGFRCYDNLTASNTVLTFHKFLEIYVRVIRYSQFGPFVNLYSILILISRF